MKKFTFAILLLAGISTLAGAQNLKFGHINSQELVSLMSEMDSARVKLQAYQVELQDTMQGMEDEYNSKYTEYNRKQATWTPAVREAKEKEIQDLIQRIQQFEQNAGQEMQQMQQILMSPVVDKAQKAIEKVAKAQGLIYVFDLSTGSLAFHDEAQSMNLLPLVKAELGIPAEKVSPSQIPAPGQTAAPAKK
ncbi:MAG: OmpH family outer membrane protein [Bacteroidales bacterium]|nr:OmpH family outer membrane protein [Bacteroidales bacterium]